MTIVGTDKDGNGEQRGAALLVVLLLVATLAFIALSITERTALAASRSVNARIHDESIWLAFGAETLAVAALESIWKVSNGKMSLDDPWASEPLSVPFDDVSGARLFFVDATACFNVNSLATDAGGASAGAVSPAIEEFSFLARNLGFSVLDGERLGSVIADWVDNDTSRLPQGAEDDYYSLLPSPYRTGNQNIASISELRAMKGFSRDVYRTLRPYLCALPDAQASSINVNMLNERHAPILAALLGENVTVTQARDLITARPPGGYANTDAFINAPAIKSLELDTTPAGRIAVTSKYIEARAEIVYDTAITELNAIIAFDESGKAAVLARRFGAEE